MYSSLRGPILAVAAVATLTACGSSDGAAGSQSSDPDALHLVASFYPLQYATQRVAGDAAEVTSLTKAGAEPHDLELSPQDVASVSDADLVVYLGGFQAAVDEAVDQEADEHALDVAPTARLDLTYTPIEEGAAAGAGALDPHFWLDPTRLADVADAIADRLSTIQPAQADAFASNAADLRADLEALDDDFTTGLRACARTDIVTSHTAFGYLAERYGLHQVGITGLTPDGEPSPQDLAAVTTFVEDNEVTTIYYETLVSPAIAETVAGETGARTAVLDPIEGLNDSSAGSDYLQVMRADLAALEDGQGCT